MTPQNAWLPVHANTDPDIRFWWLFEEDRARYSAWKSTNFATPRAALSAFWQFRPYHLHDECRAALDRRDTLLAAAQQDCTLQR